MPEDVGGRAINLVGMDGSGRAGADVEELLEDLQRRGSGRVAAVAAVLDQGADDDLGRLRRVVHGTVAAEPRLIRLTLREAGDELLRRAGLPGDVDGKVAEDGGRGAVARVRRLVEAVLDGREPGRIEVHRLRRRCGEAVHHARVGAAAAPLPDVLDEVRAG